MEAYYKPNEIKKELEQHLALNNGFAKREALKALSYISQLESKVERLKETQVIHIDISEQLKKECEYEIKTAKSDAVKEFAERLKKELSLLRKECRKYLDNNGVFAIDRVRRKVDNLLKKMGGEDNA